MTVDVQRILGKSLNLATIAIGLAIGFAGIVATANAESWTPSDAQIANLEAGIKLEALPHWNKRLPPLRGFARYYTGSARNDEQVIFGELVLPLGSGYTPGIHIVANRRAFPMIYDGGCGIINLVYSLKQQKIVSIECNGFA